MDKDIPTSAIHRLPKGYRIVGWGNYENPIFDKPTEALTWTHGYVGWEDHNGRFLGDSERLLYAIKDSSENVVDNETQLYKSIVRTLEDSDIVWPKYGCDTIRDLAKRLEELMKS